MPVSKMEKTNRLSAPGVWETVLSLLGPCKGLSVLDAPSGGGQLSEAISEKGGLVYSLDLNPPPPLSARNVKADLNYRLPFEDQFFDRIVCVEGIEHIESPAFLLREFARVLKVNGTLIVSTPNIQNLRSRIKFLLTGVPFWFGNDAIGRFGHITPVSSYALLHFARNAGFRNIEIQINRRIPWISLIRFPFMIIGALFREHCNTAELLAGEILIFKMGR